MRFIRIPKKILYGLIPFYLIFITTTIGFSKENTGDPNLQNDTENTQSYIFPITFFQKYVSRIDGQRCPMHPSCSSYSGRALKKHGLFKGWIMTCDRLMRCGRDELKHAPKIFSHGRKYSYDPVEGNDFWWKDAKSDK